MKKIIVFIAVFCTGLMLTFNINSNEVNALSDVSIMNNVSVVDDGANVYSSSNVTEIESKSKEIFDKYDINLHVLTYGEYGLNSYSAGVYADKFVSENYGTDIMYQDVIVIVVGVNPSNSTGGNHVEIVSYGIASNYISSNEAYNLINGTAYSYLEKLQWYNATIELISNIDSHISFTILLGNLLPHGIVLGIALLVSIAYVVSLVSSRGSRSTVSHSTYSKPDSNRLLGRYDRYLRTTVTRTPIQSSSSGGGGRGGGGGRSSGGRSF